MKVIAENMITAVVASSEGSTYEATNLLNSRPGSLWRGTGSSESLLFTLDGRRTSGLCLFNTNATAVSFQVYNPSAIDWHGIDWQNLQWMAEGVKITHVVNLDGESGACMVQWTPIGSSVNVLVSLTNNAGSVLRAGVGHGGEVLSYPDPSYGFTESIRDLSYIDEYNTGGLYTKDRPVARVFDMQHDMVRDSEFHSFIYDVKMRLHKRPAAWMVSDRPNPRWLVYAMFSDDPRARHAYPDDSIIQYQLTEVRS